MQSILIHQTVYTFRSVKKNFCLNNGAESFCFHEYFKQERQKTLTCIWTNYLIHLILLYLLENPFKNYINVNITIYTKPVIALNFIEIIRSL